jgi:hypothetical protein
MKKAALLIAGIVTLAAAIPAQADMAVEFGRGSELIAPLNIDEDTTGVSKRQTVVIEFFSKDVDRDLAEFVCYEAELRDLKTRRIVGYGIDCLGISPVLSEPLMGDLGDEHVTMGTPMGDKALSPQIDAVTFFFFPAGHIVVDGLTTVRPVFDGVGSGGPGGPFGDITHITGSIPGAASNIVDGSRRFTKLVGKGKVRLSGAVNTDSFFATGEIAFSCIFVFIY